MSKNVLCILLVPVIAICWYVFSLKMLFTKPNKMIEGVPVIDFSGSLWGWIGYLGTILCPAQAIIETDKGVCKNRILITIKTPLGVIYHEVAHVIYDPARAKGVSGADAHDGKGARFEHQADKWAILKLIELGKPEEVEKFIALLGSFDCDGPYRAKLARRFVRRYKLI